MSVLRSVPRVTRASQSLGATHSRGTKRWSSRSLFQLGVTAAMFHFALAPAAADLSTSPVGQFVHRADGVTALHFPSAVASISGGADFFAVCGTDGTAACWGGLNRGSPLAAPRDHNDFVAVDAGFWHVLALTNVGTVVAWGASAQSGVDEGQAQVPPGLRGVVEISAGARHSVARRENGSLALWGASGDSAVLTPPKALPASARIAAGTNCTLTVDQAGLLHGWGAAGTELVTTPPADLGAVRSVDVTSEAAIAARVDGVVRVWPAGNPAMLPPSDLPPATQVAISKTANNRYRLAALCENGTVRSWTTILAAPGDIEVPAPTSSNFVQIASTSDGFAALDANGRVAPWGQSRLGLCDPPTARRGAVEISAGLLRDEAGAIATWDEEASFFDDGVGDPVQRPTHPIQGMRRLASMRSVTTSTAGLPADYFLVSNDGRLYQIRQGFSSVAGAPSSSEVVDIATGRTGALALRSDGSFVAIGSASLPLWNFGYAQGAVGEDWCAARRLDGSVVAWGANGIGQATIPPSLGTTVDIAAGAFHGAAVRVDGSVRCWGAPGSGATTPPTDLAPARRVLCGNDYTAALLNDHTVRAWGNVPASPPASANEEIVIGMSEWTPRNSTTPQLVYLTIRDCNSNGVVDRVEIEGQPEIDCDGDGWIDACAQPMDEFEDCNMNGIRDACEKQSQVVIHSGHLGPVGASAGEILWEAPVAVHAVGPVRFDIRGHGDFSSALEYVRLRDFTSNDYDLLAGTGDCTANPAWQTLEFTPADLNLAISPLGTVIFALYPSVAVDPNLCGGDTWIEITISYLGATSADCNANGLIDTCEIAEGAAVDANGNGIPDSCEHQAKGCGADFDGDGFVAGSDLATLLNGWGTSGSTDLDGDGITAGTDLATLLNVWGPCAD